MSRWCSLRSWREAREPWCTLARGLEAEGVGGEREVAGLGSAIELKTFPRPRSPWDEFLDQGPSSSETAAQAAVELLETVRPAAVIGVQAAKRCVAGQPAGNIR